MIDGNMDVVHFNEYIFDLKLNINIFIGNNIL